MTTGREFKLRRNRLKIGCFGLSVLFFTALGQGQTVVAPEWSLPAEYGSDHPDQITLGGGYADVRGDQGRFQARTGLTDGSSGGINALSIFREPGDEFDQVLTIEAHALAGQQEYGFEIDYEKYDVWYLTATGEHHRRWYDGSTFLPESSALWLDPAEEAWPLDWGNFGFEIGTLFADWLQLKLSFQHYFRDGEKDSTIWGQLGAWRNHPAYRSIDEERQVVALELSGETEDRRWAARARYEHAESANTLHTVNDSVVNPAQPVEQKEENESDTISANGYYLLKWGEKTRLSLGASVVQVDANVGGYRDVSNGSAFVALSGESDLHLTEVNGNISRSWTDSLASVVGFRLRGEELEGVTAKNEGSGADSVSVYENRDYLDFDAELRKGIDRAGVYLKYHYGDGDGDLEQSGDFIDRLTTSEHEQQDVALGFQYSAPTNWSFNARIASEEEEDRYAHRRFDASRSRYPGYIDALDKDTELIEARATWRPHATLHLTGRVDYRRESIAPTIDGRQSGETEIERMSVSQALTFSPKPGIQLHAMAGYTDALQVSAASRPLSGQEEPFVLPVHLDFWTVQVSVYGLLNEKTDLQVTASQFRAENLAVGPSTALSYGTGERDRRINLILSRQLGERTRGILRYGYFEGTDDRSPQFENYDAQVIYASVLHRF